MSRRRFDSNPLWRRHGRYWSCLRWGASPAPISDGKLVFLIGGMLRMLLWGVNTLRTIAAMSSNESMHVV
jgi:hypothetical protein